MSTRNAAEISPVIARSFEGVYEGFIPVLPAARRLVSVVDGLGWAAALSEDFVQDFRGRAFDPQQFRPTGSLRRALRVEPRGLRLTLPEGSSNKLPVGLFARCGVHGDFEITLAYDILRIGKPTAGSCAGVSVYITMVSSTQEAATLVRGVRPSGEQVYLCHRASTPAGSKREHHGKTLLTEAQSGRLRLVRTETMLSYQAADEGSNDFHELYQTELGSADLDGVRFAADNSGSPAAVEVRLRWVSIRAENLGAASPLPKPPVRWPLWVAAAATILLLAAGGYWLWSRAGRTGQPAVEK